MSTTMKANKASRRAGKEFTNWRPNREPGKTVITVQPDDPFQSLLMPSYEPGPLPARKNYAFASNAPIQQNSPQQVFTQHAEPEFVERGLVQPSILEREYVPRQEYQKAKSSARDAWTAVTLMGMFIAGGVYYAMDRIDTQTTQIDDLTTKNDDLNKQLTNERGVVVTRNAQIEQLREQLRDAKSHKVR